MLFAPSSDQDVETDQLTGSERIDLLEELHKRYSTSGSWLKKVKYWRKKYFWIIFIQGAVALKRVIDIFLSLFLLIALFPLFLVIALYIKLHDGGPILYISNRVGKWGKEFPLPKFRTMEMDAETKLNSLQEHNTIKGDIKFKMRNDPRITWVGKFLRRYSLDELPQLWCVLKGEMSLVGPRPPLPKEVALYTLEQRRRLDILPGLTCIWQVNGRSEIPFHQQVQLDVDYIESQSFWLDIKLIAKTIPVIILGKGAY